MRITFPVLFLSLIFNIGTQATTRYAVPQNGAISGSCSALEPCTLGRCRALATSPGDVCYLSEGTYSEGINSSGNGASGNPILFECIGRTGTCVITGFAQGSIDRVIQADNNYLKFSKLVVVVPGIDGTGNRYGFRSEHTTTGVEIVDSEFYSRRDFTPSTSTNRMVAIESRGKSLKVLRNTVHDVQIGIEVNTDSGVATGTIADNTLRNINVGWEENGDCIFVGSEMQDAAFDLIIERNDCSGYTDDGIDLYGGRNVIVQDNFIHDSAESSGSNAALKVGGPRGIRTGNIIRRNHVRVRGGGLQQDYCLVTNGLSNGVISHNVMQSDSNTPCVEVSEFGIYPGGGGKGNLIENNTLDGSIALYIRVSAGAGTIARNNILVGSQSDINVEQGAILNGSGNALTGTGSTGGLGQYTSVNDIAAGTQCN